MYGNEAGISASTLAATGAALSTGSIILTAVAVILGAAGAWLLFRKESKVKP